MSIVAEEKIARKNMNRYPGVSCQNYTGKIQSYFGRKYLKLLKEKELDMLNFNLPTLPGELKLLQFRSRNLKMQLNRMSGLTVHQLKALREFLKAICI